MRSSTSIATIPFTETSLWINTSVIDIFQDEEEDEDYNEPDQPTAKPPKTEITGGSRYSCGGGHTGSVSHISETVMDGLSQQQGASRTDSAVGGVAAAVEDNGEASSPVLSDEQVGGEYGVLAIKCCVLCWRLPWPTGVYNDVSRPDCGP